MRISTKRAAVAIAALFAAGEMNFGAAFFSHGPGSFISSAHARAGRSAAPRSVGVHRPVRVGRPATPGSVAGVARRTTRRTIRRGAYIATIPRGCSYGTYYGYNLYYCGGTYYQRSGSGYVIVYF